MTNRVDYGGAALVSLVALFAIALRSSPARAQGALCSAEALQPLAPAGMNIGSIPNMEPPEPKLASPTGVKLVPANALGDGAPEFCFVTGTIVTDARAHRVAHFEAALPSKAIWNGKFMFQGCGGNCGTVQGPPNALALRKGYPVWLTDDGHVAKKSPDPRLWWPADASWAVTAPGHRDQAAMTDFYYRAVHTVTEIGKAFTKRYYTASKLKYSYFEGCSDGGREAMVELTHYPQDYDGIIAGAPYFDIKNEIATTLVSLVAQLRSPGAAIPQRLWEAANRIITEKCDSQDGVQDGLIQDPQSCTFNPYRDLPKCAAAEREGACFTSEQIDTLSIIFSAKTNPAGEAVYPGWSVSDIAFPKEAGVGGDLLAGWLGFPAPPDNLRGPQPWSANPREQPLGWYWSEQTAKYFVYDGRSDFNALTTLGVTFERGADGAMHTVVPERTIELFREKTLAGSGATPADAARFLRQGRKLIMFHGYSDGDITPYRTVQYYDTLATLQGGMRALERNARLYMVPGMAHCAGGPGPNQFGQLDAARAYQPKAPDHDILASLEDWVEKGRAPAAIIATKYERDDPHARVTRTMPLCPYPAMARYSGKGDVNDAANWQCRANDHRLLKKGPVGIAAGVFAPLK